MLNTVEIPVWLLTLILGFAGVTFASHFLFPSVRWFFRRRLERAVAGLNQRLQRPIAPFKLLERHDRILRLVYDPQVMEAVVEHARSRGVPESVAFETARRYAREIVPGFSATVYFSVAARLARLISRLMYRVRVGAADEDALRAIDPDATVIFVMNHRSNMDYVLVTWLVSERMTLSYAVGEWARVWPFSRLVRAMGAYFIRRRHLNPLYRRVLERFVQMTTAEGVSQAIFPEGGLSLDGRVGPAKLGLLGYILAGHDPDRGRDVVFVPVALAYDRVLEDRLLTEAAAAGTRRFRARPTAIAAFVMRMIWRIMRRRFGGFGMAGVSFGTPQSLRGFLAANPGADTSLLAGHLMDELRRALPVLPVPLVAEAIRMGPVDREGLTARVGGLLLRLRAIEAVLLQPSALPETLTAEALRPLLARGIVAERDGCLAVVPGMERLLAFHAAPIGQILEAAPCALAAAPPGDTSSPA